MTTTTSTVTGMTCEHSVRAVTEEVSNVPDVTDVQVDRATGRMALVSRTTVDDASVRAAVEEAGYEVAA